MNHFSKNRLEALSDGVIAIIITVMVLELRAPHEARLAALRPLLPALSIAGLAAEGEFGVHPVGAAA